MIHPPNIQWRKSSHSGDQGGECVEIAVSSGGIVVRDSKDPNGPVITFTRRNMRALFDRLRP